MAAYADHSALGRCREPWAVTEDFGAPMGIAPSPRLLASVMITE
jgi:hypothetical protein